MGFIPSDDGDDSDVIAKSVLDGSYFDASPNTTSPSVAIGNAAPKPRPKGKNNIPHVIDDEFEKLGYSPTARLSILGDVGRENAWNRDTIFKGHADPKNKKFNRGIISWQGDRVSKLDNHLKKEGVYGKGDDDELRGMVRFMDNELKTEFPDVYNRLTKAKTTYDASEALRKYIKYVPDGKYNSYDPEFRVKNNARWAKEAKKLGLAQDRFDADAYAASLFEAQGQPQTNIEPRPATERPETLNAQRFAANSPKSTRAGVLYTDASTVPPITEQEFDIPIQGNQVLRVNKLKFQQYQDQTGISPELISIGQADFTPLIGGKAQPTGEVVGTTGKIAVMSIGADGKERVSSSVTDPSAVIDEAILHKKQFPDEEIQTKVVTAEEVIAARQPDDATTVDEGQMEGTDTSIVEVPDSPNGGFTTTGFDVDPANTPEIADKGEAVYRQAVSQLGKQLFGRDLNELEMAALVEEQRQAKGGFAYERGTDTAKQVEGKDRFVFEPEDVKRITAILDGNQENFAKIREGNLRDFLAAGGELDADAADRFARLGMTTEEINALTGLAADNTVSTTPFMESVKAERDKYKALLKGYKSSEDEYQKFNAQTRARQDMGWITPQQAIDEIAEFDSLKTQRKGEIADMSNLTMGGLGPWDKDVKSASPEEQEAKLQDYLKQTIGKYGTAMNRKLVLEKEANDEKARKKRTSEMPWSEYLMQTAKDIPMNFAKSAVSTAVSGSLRGIALGAKKIDDALYGEDNQRKEVSAYGSYQLAKRLDDMLDRTLATDKDMQGEFLAGKLPQGLGSTLGMALGGASKTPRLAVAVLSSLQMGGDAYKEAKDGGATEEEAQQYGMMSAPLGVSEIAGIGGAITRLSKGTGGTVWKKLWKEAYNAGKGEMGEELLQEGFQTTAQNVIGRLTYDPDRKADKNLFDNLIVAGISAPLASAGVTILNVARNRNALKKVIAQEQANGVIIKSFGDGELYVFGEKVDVTPDLKPMVDRYDNSRKGILEKQQQIATIQKGAEGKSIAEMEPYLEALWTAKKDLVSLEKRQVQISKDIAEKAGIPVPEGTVEETITADVQADEDLLAPITNETTQAEIPSQPASIPASDVLPDAKDETLSALEDTPATDQVSKEPESISQTNEKTPNLSKVDSFTVEPFKPKGTPLETAQAENPAKRIATPKASAIQQVAKDGSAIKIANILEGSHSKTLAEIVKATKFTPEKVQNAIRLMYDAGKIEIRPDNGIKLIEPVVDLNQPLYEQFDEQGVVQPKAAPVEVPVAEQNRLKWIDSVNKRLDELAGKDADYRQHLSEGRAIDKASTGQLKDLHKRLEGLKPGDSVNGKTYVTSKTAEIEPKKSETPVKTEVEGDVKNASTPIRVYRGTNEVNSKTNGLFYSTDKNFASDYGDTKEYDLTINRPFDATNEADVQRLLDIIGGEITDPYDDTVYTDAKEAANAFGHDSWETLEPYQSAIESLGYDGLKMFEGGTENYQAFSPDQVKEVEKTPSKTSSRAEKPTSSEAKKPAQPKHKSLSQLVREHGGIRLTAADKGEGDRIRNKETGSTGLINKNSKFSAEHMAGIAWEHGYLRDVWETMSDVSGNELMGFVEEDVRGIKKYYSQEALNELDTDFAAQEEEYYAAKQADRASNEYIDAQNDLLSREVAVLNDKDAQKVLANLVKEGQNVTDVTELQNILAKYGLEADFAESIIDAYREARPESETVERADEGEPRASDEESRAESVSPFTTTAGREQFAADRRNAIIEEFGLDPIADKDVLDALEGAGVTLFSRSEAEIEKEWKTWRRKTITYRGVAEEAATENGRGAMLGRGLYTAPSSNKGMTREYGKMKLVANARPKNPKVFDNLNRWEIWAQGNLYNKFSKNEFPDVRSFNANTTIEAEMQKMGYDGIEIKGREIVNFAPPDNVVYFDNERQARQYFDAVVATSEPPTILRSIAASTQPFYSRVERVIADKMPPKATKEQITALLAKNSVKELDPEAQMVKVWLEDQGGSVSKADVLEFVAANRVETQSVVKGTSTTDEKSVRPRLTLSDNTVLLDGKPTDFSVVEEDGTYVVYQDDEPAGNTRDTEAEALDAIAGRIARTTDNTKFSQYQLPGESSNYREEFVTAPEDVYGYHVKGGGFDSTRFQDKAHAERQATALREDGHNVTVTPLTRNNWKDGHSDYADVKNPIVRLRYADRTTTDGDSMLFGEEIQQPGEGQFEKMPKVYQKYGELIGIKKLLFNAVQGGYDYLGLTTGKQQVDRYQDDLRQNVDQIDWHRTGDNTVKVVSFKDGIKGLDHEFNIEGETTISGHTATLSRIVGKQIANDIKNAAVGDKNTVSGDGLTIGGEALAGRYDKGLVGQINKLLKPYGASVEMKALDTGEFKVNKDSYELPFRLEKKNTPDIISRHATAEEAWDAAEKLGAEPIYAIQITPELREAFGGGQPLFKLRNSEDFDALYNVLPYLKNAGELLEFATGGTLHENGELELSPYDAEVTRRLLAELETKRTGRPNAPVSDAGVYDVGTLKALAWEADAQRKKLEAAGYPQEYINNIKALATNLRDAAKHAKDFGILYAFDDALPEERFHQEDLRAGRTDAKAIAELKNSPFWDGSAKFDETYGKLSDADKASEIVAKLATGQEAEYGWDKVPGFAKARDTFFDNWLEGVIRNNESVIAANGIDAFLKKFQRIGKLYAETKTGQQKEGSVTETQGSGTERVRGSSGTGSTQTRSEDAGTGELVRDPAVQKADQSPESIEGDGRTMVRGTVASAERYGVIGQNEITGQARYYQVKDTDERARRAQDKIERIGIDAAFTEAIQPIESFKDVDEQSEFQWQTMFLLGDMAETALANGDTARATLLTAQKKQVLETLSVQGTPAGRLVQSYDRVRRDDARTVADYIERRRKQQGYNEELTEAERTKAKELALALAVEHEKVLNLEARIANLEESQRKGSGKLTRSQKNLVKTLSERSAAALARIKGVALRNIAPTILRMVAWHGSPHTFDKFDISKIGTGEGAQAYGHGLYFTDQESIAQHYKNALEKRTPVVLKINGIELNQDNSLSEYSDALNDDAGDQYDTMYFRAIIEAIEDENLDTLKILDRKLYAHVREILRNNDIEVIKPRGAKYRVDLKPAADEYLLWDKPLSEQSEKVKKALVDAKVIENDKFGYAMVGGYYGSRQDAGNGKDLMAWLAGTTGDKYVGRKADEMRDSQDFWRTTSDYLKSLGIRGIKYLDGTSRGKGEGSYNYVIFDDSDVEIQEILRNIAPPTNSLSGQLLDDLADIGAEILFNGFYEEDVITRAEFDEQFNAETDGKYKDELDRIHAYSMNRLSELRAESNAQNAVERVRAENPEATPDEIAAKIADENAAKKARNAVRNEHRKLANAILKSEGVLTKRQKASLIKQYEAAQAKGEKSRLAAKQKVLDFLETAATISPKASTEVLSAAGIIEADPSLSSSDVSKRLRTIFPNLEPAKDASNAERTKAYNDINTILGQAKKLRDDVKAENWKQAEIARGKTEEAVQAMKDAKRARTEARQSFDSLVTRLEKPPANARQKAAQLQKMMMVSALNTAVNNMVSGVATRGQHRIVDLIDVGLQKAFRKLGKELKDEGLTADTRWMDVLGYPQGKDAGFADYFKQTAFAHSTILAALDEHPELFNEIYGDYSSDIDPDAVREGKNGMVHKALDAGILVFDKANIFNRWQEYFVRDLEAIHALQTRVGQRGLNLSELEKNGELNKITLEDWRYAIDRARMVTFALHPEKGSTADKVLRTLNNNPVPAVIFAPFAKFSWNAWNMSRKWLPGIALVRAGRRVMSEDGATAKDLFNPTKYTSREMANNLAGFMFFAAAYGLVSNLGDRDDWYYLKIPFTDGMGRTNADGTPSALYVDIRQHPQFVPFVYMANKLNRLIEGKDMFNYDDTKTIASELGEVFFSLSYRQAIDQNSLVQGIGHGISSALKRGDEEGREKAWYLLSKFAGERLGMAFSPFRPLKNVMDSMSKTGDLDMDAYPFTQGFERNIPKYFFEKGRGPALIGSDKGFDTKKNAVTGAEKKFSPYAYLKPLGLNIVDDQTAEPEMSQTLRTAKKLAAVDKDGNTRPYTPPVTAAEKKERDTKKDIYGELKRLEKLETPGMTKEQKDELYKPVTDAIKRATDAGILTEGQGDKIEKGFGKTQLESYIKKATAANALTILRTSQTDTKLTDAEKADVEDEIKRKFATSKAVTAADRKKLAAILDGSDRQQSFKKGEQSFIDSVMTYAQAIGTDPMTAFDRMISGQKIRRLDNGTIIVERMSLEESQKVKKERGDKGDLRLDHTLPLQLGGDNSESNLKLVTEDEWKKYTPVENAIGTALRKNAITKADAQQMIVDFKNGEISAEDVRTKLGITRLPNAPKTKKATKLTDMPKGYGEKMDSQASYPWPTADAELPPVKPTWPKFGSSTGFQTARQSENVIDKRDGSPLDIFRQKIRSDNLDEIKQASFTGGTAAERYEAKRILQKEINEARRILKDYKKEGADPMATKRVLNILLDVQNRVR